MEAITFVVILLSLAVTIISVSLWMFVQDFREIRRMVLMLEADRKTEPNCSEKPNNCETCANGESDIEACGYCRHGDLYEPKDEPQIDCDNLINAVVKLDMSREDKFKVIELLEQHCEKCKHYLFTDIDGYYCEHETYGQRCAYEPKDEPQTEEWYTWQDEQEYNARHGKE